MDFLEYVLGEINESQLITLCTLNFCEINQSNLWVTLLHEMF